jgi:hypothetical protein
MPSRLTVVLASLLLATPAVSFWLWLVIVPARVSILCPDECNCDIGGYNVSCSGPSLNPLPLIHLTDVRILILDENNITLLEKDSFVSLTELEDLYIQKCGLITVELGAFNGLTELKILSMWGNNICERIPGLFENMNSLKYLILFKNGIEHLDRDVFSGLVNLKALDLSQNKLQYIHPDTIFRLHNLKELDLSYNPTLTIPTDRNLINSHSLIYLGIKDSNISSLSVETFANVSALSWLDLSKNNLRTVDINILRVLPKLWAIFLYGNPLQCDCPLQEVWRWCKDRNIQTVYVEIAPKCDTPREVEGMWWDVIEKGQCLEGNIQYYGDYNSTSYNYTGNENFYDQIYDMDFIKHYKLPI